MRRRATLSAGAGLLTGGLGVLACALLVAEGVYPTSSAVGKGVYEPAVDLGLAAGCAVSAVVVVAWVLVVTLRAAAGRLPESPLPRFLPAVAVLLVGIGIWSVVRSVQAGGAPFPGDRALLVTVACGFVLAGTLVVHLAATRLWSSMAAPRPWSRRDVVRFVGGVTAVVVAAGTTVAVLGEPARVEATTTAVVQAPPTPTDPARVSWRWPGRSVREVVAAGAGIVVTSADGIIAVDGRTGQERWRHQLNGIPPWWSQFNEYLVAVDAGRGVIASLDGRLHAFDAFTGELTWRDEEATAHAPPSWTRMIVATDATVVRHRYSPVPEFVGTDVRTGRSLWRHVSERPGCAMGADAVSDTVIIEYWCDDAPKEELVGLDGATGAVLWRRPGDALVRDGVVLDMDEDGGLLDPRSGRRLAVPESAGRVLASDAGEIITSTGSLFELGNTESRWDVPDLSPAGHDFSYVGSATLLGDTVVVGDDRSCPGGAGVLLVLAERSDGALRRWFDCGDLPGTFGGVIPAPGALVLRTSDGLVGLG